MDHIVKVETAPTMSCGHQFSAFVARRPPAAWRGRRPAGRRIPVLAVVVALTALIVSRDHFDARTRSRRRKAKQYRAPLPASA